MQDFHFKPDFVMFGTRHAENHFMIFASSQLSETKLITKLRQFDFRPWGPWGTITPPATIGEILVDLKMAGIIVGIGHTYAEAMENLLGEWQPPGYRGGPPQIEPERRELNR